MNKKIGKIEVLAQSRGEEQGGSSTTTGDLVTVDGIQYYFASGQIAAISDRGLSTRDITTCVFGLTPSGYLQFKENVQDFMSHLKLPR
jgi:hypothetical protein